MSYAMNANVYSKIVQLLLCSLILCVPAAGAQTRDRLDLETEIRPFAAATGKQFALSAARIEALLVHARINAQVLKAIQRPAEAMLWRDYRKIFMTARRIDSGVEFWKQNRATLERAQRQFGVAPETIVAIIGVETLYGTRKGTIRVLDALTTLGFRYPKRSRFFRSELQHYLLLVDSEHLDPLELKGSYAGAMGIPQFIPSSYRRYAVDFDANRQRDLVNSEVDAIGSVANYLARHGWRTGARVAEAVSVDAGVPWRRLQERGLKPHTRISELRRLGLSIGSDHPDDPLAALIVLRAEGGREYWLGLNNFYVITRYNHSPLYAMAVYQLAVAIKETYSAGRQ